MPTRPPLARISITIPADLLKLADQLATQMDRSRSWVIGEAVRRMAQAPLPAVVREPIVSPYAGSEEEMEAARLRRLRADLAATPDVRLLQAEDMVRLSRIVHPPKNRQFVISFDSYEDFDRWKTTHRAAR